MRKIINWIYNLLITLKNPLTLVLFNIYGQGINNYIMIYYLFYSLSIMIFWGLLLLKMNEHGNLGVFMALIYTFYSTYLIRNTVEKENQNLKLLKAIGPLFYFASNIVINFKFKGSFLINPINIACLFFGISYFSKGKMPNKTLQFFAISFIYLYSFSIYDIWINSSYSRLPKYDFTKKNHSTDVQVYKSTLSDYNFLNSNKDTITLKNNNKFTIIETWNEKCIPCLRAISDLQSYYKSISKFSNQFYIYEPANKYSDIDFEKVFSFNEINEKEKILVDLNKQMYAELELSGYPYFLLFNNKGKLIYKKLGYSFGQKKKLQDTIFALIKTN